MNEEEKKAIKSMKRFVEYRQDMATVTASEMKTVLNLLEKKDKIIDLMAIAIDNEPLPTEEYCIFRNFDCPAVGGNRDCKYCIKQYFERKVEEDK